ncbi:MarR family transcriptional regulator [Vibrio aphrogenes]|uniref:MarR family transcriptional regulator n=1 Tax=Vibrio aphrogenes TaxID=1891186 RepID=UPI000B357EE0|nr:MarR family transcriptional regulator [Vibrio aphrogenes]
MRLAHKRNVQLKLKKKIKATKVTAEKTAQSIQSKVEKTVAKTKSTKVKVEKVVNKALEAAVETSQDIKLTPKQQQILDIVAANAEGINPKAIGLAAEQEEAKAAAWATGGLKKLLEENLVVKEQLSGNKVMYKLA